MNPVFVQGGHVGPISPRLRAGPVLFGMFLLLGGCGLVNNDDPEESAIGSRDPFPLVGEYFYAAWGPDDRLAVIYMQHSEDGTHHLLETWGLYTLGTDGSDRRRVVLNREIGASILNPTWSPDGEWIAFSGGGEIFKVRPDGSDLTRLTHGGEAKFGPAWSPDGEWIAFRVIYGPDEGRGIWVVSADGVTVRQLRKPPLTEMCLDCQSLDRWVLRNGPDWSVHPHEMVYVGVQNRVGARHMAVYDTAAVRVDFIYQAPATLYRPQFSPDGTRILFFIASDGTRGLRTGIINRNGTGLRWLREHAVDPSWSPDGRRIVYRLFSYQTSRFGTPGFGDLWIMNADGTGNHQITFSTGEK